MFFLLFKRNSKQRTLRVILFYILYCILNEALGYYLQRINSDHFFLLLYGVTLIEYSFFCYFIFLILPKKPVRRIVPFIWIGFIAFSLVDLTVINKGMGFDSIAIGIESLIIILLCIYYLFTQLRGSTNLLIYSTFDFWVVITFLIYFAGTFFLYIMTESMSSSTSFQNEYFIINIVFNVLKNLLLSIAMMMRLNTINNSEPSSLPNLDDDDIFIHQKNN